MREGDRIVFQCDKHGRVMLQSEGRDPLGSLLGPCATGRKIDRQP